MALLLHLQPPPPVAERLDLDGEQPLAAYLLDRIAPANAGYRHGCEGPDDMPAHIKTMVTGPSVGIPVLDGRMDLGTWQGLYLIEHRARGRPRTLTLHYLGN